MQRKRLDDLMIERGEAPDKNQAFILVTEGRVIVNSQKAISPAQMVRQDAVIEIRGEAKYVGRGALKLEAALDQFGIDPRGKTCADIGAATGGFTQVLLERGAKKVYAIDTARGKLALKLRRDPRVVVMEKTDARKLESLPEPIDLATSDISLIPLEQILPHVRRIAPQAEIVALFKPQYETRNPAILKHGIVRDDRAREKIVSDFEKWLSEHHWTLKGKIASPIKGDKGNKEYLFVIYKRVVPT